jgi:hypothetical protein
VVCCDDDTIGTVIDSCCCAAANNATNKLSEGLFRMRKLLLTLVAACAVVFAACSAPAAVMSAGTAPGLKAAATAASPVTEAVYICKQRYWSGKRYCYWRPGGYHWRWRWRWWR